MACAAALRCSCGGKLAQYSRIALSYLSSSVPVRRINSIQSHPFHICGRRVGAPPVKAAFCRGARNIRAWKSSLAQAGSRTPACRVRHRRICAPGGSGHFAAPCPALDNKAPALSGRSRYFARCAQLNQAPKGRTLSKPPAGSGAPLPEGGPALPQPGRGAEGVRHRHDTAGPPAPTAS